MKLTKIFVAMFFVIFFSSLTSFAETIYEDLNKFELYNPDTHKPEFLQNYITALTYLYSNEKRYEKVDYTLTSQDSVRDAMDVLLRNNVNLRIARNLLSEYIGEKNQFMSKASDQFKILCDELIGYNKKEVELLKTLYDAYVYGTIDDYDRDNFLQQQQENATNRKTSQEMLFRTTMLVNKIIISPKLDSYGELAYLALNAMQREDALNRLDAEFYGDLFQGDVREGQTYLQASVVSMKKILEDSTWKSL